MCSKQDGCWAYTRSNQPLNQTSPADRLASNKLARSRSRSKRLSRHPTESNFLVRVVLCVVIWITHTVLFTLFLGMVLLVVPLCYCVKKVILYYSLRHHRGDKLTKMPDSEAVWLESCANTEQKIPVSNVFFIFEGTVNMNEVQDLVRDGLLPQGKLRHFPVRVMAGYGWQELNDFDISNYAFESFDKSFLIPVELKGMTQARNNENFEVMWRVLSFPNFNDSEDTGVLIQIHESIADVFPSSRIVLESLGYKTIYLKRRCFLLGRVATYLSACYTGPLVILKRLLMRKTDASSFTGCHESRDLLHVTWSRAVDLKSVKRIKDITRTKVDVILLSCVAGAIRAFLQKCRALDPDDIQVCIRTDVRPSHARLNLDNKFSLAFIKLPVGTEGAVPRLWETRRRVDNFSFKLESIITYGFTKLCLLLFPLSVVRRLINYLINKVPCTVTQIPGPNTPVYLNGKMAKMMACWTPRKTESGLSICLTNHGGQVHLGLVGHHCQVSDSSVLLAEFEREVADLANHLAKRALPSHLRWRHKSVNQRVNEVAEEREVGEEEAV